MPTATHSPAEAQRHDESGAGDYQTEGEEAGADPERDALPQLARSGADPGTQWVTQLADPCAALPAAAASPFPPLCRCFLCLPAPAGRTAGLPW
jgi:hypothetical protein